MEHADYTLRSVGVVINFNSIIDIYTNTPCRFCSSYVRYYNDDDSEPSTVVSGHDKALGLVSPTRNVLRSFAMNVDSYCKYRVGLETDYDNHVDSAYANHCFEGPFGIHQVD